MSEQDQGFTVKDRRSLDDSGNLKSTEHAAEAAEAPEAPAEPEPAADNASGESAQYHLPPVDFSGLILSLAQAAMMHLGHLPDPSSGQAVQPNLPLARHAIDTIGMLKEKTKGNLSDEERRLIETILTDLRLAYVQMNK